jgi:hypothetical protein
MLFKKTSGRALHRRWHRAEIGRGRARGPLAHRGRETRRPRPHTRGARGGRARRPHLPEPTATAVPRVLGAPFAAPVPPKISYPLVDVEHAPRRRGRLLGAGEARDEDERGGGEDGGEVTHAVRSAASLPRKGGQGDRGPRRERVQPGAGRVQRAAQP